MSELYLKSAEFSNFRVYGDSYAFEFLPFPSVTLISGGNGLGKTSFFDGVEWALTNQVGRFGEIPVDGRRKNLDPLTRIGAEEGSHRVSLQFSDGSLIDRGNGFDAPESEIVRLLKRPEWAEISSLHGYLSITHFFGQASQQRFSLKRPTDQWEALKGPAGMDRINSLRDRLSGQGVKRAFTRALEDRREKLAQAVKEFTEWGELVQERDRLRQLAVSDRAVSASEVLAEAGRTGDDISAAMGRDRWTQPAASTPEVVLEDLSGFLRIQTLRVDAELVQIDDLGRLWADTESAKGEQTTVNARLREIETRLNTATSELHKAQEFLSGATDALRAEELDVNRAKERLASLDRVQTLVARLSEANTRLTAHQMHLASSEVVERDAELRLEKLQREHAAAVQQRLERRALADRLALAKLRFGISDSRKRLASEIDRTSARIANRDVDELRAARVRTLDFVAAMDAKIASLVSDFQRYDQRVRTIREAVSTIAHQLTHEDTACPVCATEFSPGLLLEAVKTELSAAGEKPATQFAEDIATARIHADTLRTRISRIDQELADVAQNEAVLASLRSQDDQLGQQIIDAGGIPGTDYDGSEVASLQNELHALDGLLSEANSPEAVAVLVDAARAALSSESAKRLSTQQLLGAASAELNACRSSLLQHLDLWSPDAGILVDLNHERQLAEDDAKARAERLSALTSELNESRARVDAIRAHEAADSGAIASARATLQTIASRIGEIQERWTRAGFAGDPNAERLASQRQALLDKATRLRPLEGTIGALVAGYRKWLNDEHLARYEVAISTKLEALQAPSVEGAKDILIDRIESARMELERVERTRDKVDEIGGVLRDQAKMYASDVLVPLNATINRFARTLMTWSESSVNYKAEHFASRSELRPNVVLGETDGSRKSVELNPSLYFSEGQLSALSVAALLAASTTFGWSRWRGLLLDDPLQHNDVIHASAFMDLLRQMVLGLGYQIILSTHDSTEAEFLSRKCRSAGIPYQLHELAPRGPEGLVNPSSKESHAALR